MQAFLAEPNKRYQSHILTYFIISENSSSPLRPFPQGIPNTLRCPRIEFAIHPIDSAICFLNSAANSIFSAPTLPAHCRSGCPTSQATDPPSTAQTTAETVSGIVGNCSMHSPPNFHSPQASPPALDSNAHSRARFCASERRCVVMNAISRLVQATACRY